MCSSDLASGVGDHALACEVLEHAEEFGCKDGMNPDMYGRTGTPIRDIRYAEALETLPIAPHLVLWESNHGASIGCHPLAMFRWMVDRPEYSHLIHVWAVNDCSGIPRDVMERLHTGRRRKAADRETDRLRHRYPHRIQPVF